MATKTSTHRATGRAYLATISEICPPDVWGDIVAKAVEDAKRGDPKARDWLASYLVGKPGGEAETLHALAVAEAAGSDPVERDAGFQRLISGI